MSRFDPNLLRLAMAAVDKTIDMEKKGFVPMPGGQGEPVAGASDATAALAGGGMDGGMPPGDPAGMPVDASGMPVDPGTGLPMDHAAGGTPPPGAPMDPGMAPMPTPPDPSAGGMPMPGADGMITMPVSQFITLLETLGAAGKKGAGVKPAGTPAQPQGGNMETQISGIYQALSNMGAIQPQKTAAHPLAGTGLGALIGGGLGAYAGHRAGTIATNRAGDGLASVPVGAGAAAAGVGAGAGAALGGLIDIARAIARNRRAKEEDAEQA